MQGSRVRSLRVYLSVPVRAPRTTMVRTVERQNGDAAAGRRGTFSIR
jgi:hypothetical protein